MIAVGLAFPATALAEKSEETFKFRPSLALEVNATDNVRRTAINRESDVVLLPRAGLLVEGKLKDFEIFGSAGLAYNSFLENSSLDRFSGSLLTNATFTAVPELLYVDGSAQISDEFLSLADQSATGLPNGRPQARIFNYQLSPYVRSTLFGEVDTLLRARVSALRTDALNPAGPGVTLGNSTSYQGNVLFGNGERSRVVEWRLSGDYTIEKREANREFESADGLLGLSIRVLPKVRLLARGGYEDISDTSIKSIHGAVWAGGINYRLGEDSEITGEYRHRFGRETWFGDARLTVSSRLAFTAGYDERLESQQLRLGRSLTDLFSQNGSAAPPATPSPFSLGEDLVDQVFFAKDARLGAIYREPERSFELLAKLSKRGFEGLNTEDKTAGASARYTENLRSDLMLNFSGDYAATLDARTGQTPFDRYEAASGLVYRLSDDATATVEYTWSQTVGVGTITENLVSASVAKTF